MLHLIDAAESALAAGNNYAALALCLAMPDICGWIEDPKTTSRARYTSWFDRYLKQHYTSRVGALGTEHAFLSASDFYALRCAYLHEGRDEITDQRAQDVLTSFQFVVPPSGWAVHCNQVNSTLQLQVNIFCTQVIEGVKSFVQALEQRSEAAARLGSLLLIRDINGVLIRSAA